MTVQKYCSFGWNQPQKLHIDFNFNAMQTSALNLTDGSRKKAME